MRHLHALITRWASGLLAAVSMAAAVGLLAYTAGALGSQTGAGHVPATPALVTAAALAGTPVSDLAQLDPAIVAYLAWGQPDYGAPPLQVDGVQLAPVGAFLPRTGNTRFALPRTPLPPTPSPDPHATLPYPTSPPLPTPVIPTTAPGTPTPDLVATVQAFAASVPYSQPVYGLDECAPSGRPVDGTLTQYFHRRHSGIDLSAPTGTPVLATHSGIIIWAEWNTFGYGNLVIIQSGVFITYYAHLNAANVSTGDFVLKGSIIGWSGSTGNSSGPHVHYETRINDVPVDPLTFEGRGYVSC